MPDKSGGDIPPETMEYLRGLIDSFNVSTARLQEAYAGLQKKVESLNLELERKNRDLTASLAEQERLSGYLTNILESLSSGVLAVDADGIITLFNPGAAEITGVPVGNALGKTYDSVIGGESGGDATIHRTLETGRGAAQREKNLRSADGRNVPVGYSISPLTNAQGEASGAVEVFMDLSRIKALEDELARKEKLAALGQMAATMAHKIRNPLGGIAGFAGLLGMELAGNENGRRLLGKITEGVDKLERIVTTLLAYTAAMTLDNRPADLADLVRDTVTGVQDDDGKPDVAIVCPEESVIAEIDPEHFRIALRNLLHNAVEAVLDGGEITVTICTANMTDNPVDSDVRESVDEMTASRVFAGGRESTAIIAIKDTGLGMDERSISQLFVPFYTTKENGIGLGLAHARKIIEEHRGVIDIKSGEGEGTLVTVAIPKRHSL